MRSEVLLANAAKAVLLVLVVVLILYETLVAGPNWTPTESSLQRQADLSSERLITLRGSVHDPYSDTMFMEHAAVIDIKGGQTSYPSPEELRRAEELRNSPRPPPEELALPKKSGLKQKHKHRPVLDDKPIRKRAVPKLSHVVEDT